MCARNSTMSTEVHGCPMKKKEGSATAMAQSGLTEDWRNCAMECYSFLRNVHDKMTDGKAAHERRIGVAFDGPMIPFGATISYKPISSKCGSRLHQLGQRC